MRLYIDLDSLLLVQGPGNNQPRESIRVKRGTSPKFEVQFLRDGAPELLPDGIVIRFMLKPKGEYDGEATVFTDVFTAPGTADGYYTGKPSFNTTDVNTLLGSPDGTTTNDEEFVDVMGEFTWYLPEQYPEKSETFTVTILNAVDNGNEAAPTEAVPNLGDRVTALESLLDGTSFIPHLKANKITIEGTLTPALSITNDGTGGSPVVSIETTNMDFVDTVLGIRRIGSDVLGISYEGAITANAINTQTLWAQSEVKFSGLTTSDPSNPGVIWTNSGTLMVS